MNLCQRSVSYICKPHPVVNVVHGLIQAVDAAAHQFRDRKARCIVPGPDNPVTGGEFLQGFFEFSRGDPLIAGCVHGRQVILYLHDVTLLAVRLLKPLLCVFVVCPSPFVRGSLPVISSAFFIS